MSRVKMSEGVMAILDGIVEAYGDIELSAENMTAICGVDTPKKVKDLSETQLLQYSLIHSQIQVNELLAKIERITANRATRRAARKGLILPS